jgi:endogenous inhibitor of DNA gyrase (YacG/DUF329 family)
MKIFCANCQKDVDAEKVTGKEIYPHRPDLAGKILYRCPICGNYVGTHKKDGRPYTPLSIPCGKRGLFAGELFTINSPARRDYPPRGYFGVD